ncbi:MAG: tripartite tricarboxylate transporter substrate binding protein [Pseudomonadota bacterium]|jgi:tripartite-type tricarboxylate transporter receptor subunit TctC
MSLDRSLFSALTVTGTLALVAVAAHAQDRLSFPAKPIRFIVPLTAGGPTDMIGRIIASPLSATLNQPVVIDNRPGAAGNIAAEMVAKAPPDGYTLFLAGPGNLAINPSLFSKLPYDPVRDFAPIILMGTAPYVVVVHPSVPAKTLQELIRLARARPGELDYGAVTGNAAHLATELFRHMAKINIVHIPYKGAAVATTDLLAGQIQLSFASAPGSMPHVQSGKLRALAVTSTTRMSTLPNIPTVDESGIKGFEAAVWYGLVAPARTPRSVIDLLNTEIVKIIRNPGHREKLIANNFEPATSTPEQFQAFIKAEIDKWGMAVKLSGATAE